MNHRRAVLIAGTALLLAPGLAVSDPKNWVNGVRVGRPLPAHDGALVQGVWRSEAALTLVDFWATWCAPCIVAIPEINALADRFADRGLQVVGVTAEAPDIVAPVVRRNGIRYTVVAGGSKPLTTTLKVRALPYAMFVDAAGVVVWRGSPGAIDDALVESLLAGR